MSATSSAPAKSMNVVWHHSTISRSDREERLGHKGVLLWFTGLSGSGKSTLAHAIEARLFDEGCQTCVLDGDNVRHGLCADLGFSKEDREENIRRVGEVAKMFVILGTITLTAFISPFRADRERVRTLTGECDFLEIYCQCPIEVCEQRDVKGLYQKARQGEIPEFTGISSPYEPPLAPALVLDTGSLDVEQCVDRVLSLLAAHGVVASAAHGVRGGLVE